MKPLGMALAARISYLETQGRSHDRAHLRCRQSVPSRSLLSAPAPPPPAPAAPSPCRLTVGGTPGRRSCWGSPGGRFGCLPRPRCTAAAPAPGRRPACPTAKMQRAVGCWGLEERQAPNLRPGDPPRQAMGGSLGAPSESSAEGLVPSLILAGTSITWGFLPDTSPSLAPCPSPVLRLLPPKHLPIRPLLSPLPSTCHPLLLPRWPE